MKFALESKQVTLPSEPEITPTVESVSEAYEGLLTSYMELSDAQRNLDEVCQVMENIELSMKMIKAGGMDAVKLLNVDKSLEGLLGVAEEKMTVESATEGITDALKAAWEKFKEWLKKVCAALRNFFNKKKVTHTLEAQFAASAAKKMEMSKTEPQAAAPEETKENPKPAAKVFDPNEVPEFDGRLLKASSMKIISEFWTDVFELMTNINNYVKKAFADPDNNATDILKTVLDPWMEKNADRIGVVYSVDNGSSSWGDQFTINVAGEILFGKQGSSWKDLGYTDVDTAKQLCDVYEKYCTDYNSHFVNQEWANGAYERYQIKPGNKGHNSVQTFGSMMRVVMYVTSSLNNIDVQFSRAAHSTIGLLEKAINHPAAEES